MSSKESQEEELEVLHSIYDGDDSFKEINSTTFQYKYGEDGTYKSFLVELSWTDNYPEECPLVSLEAFYNKHILNDVKEKIKGAIEEQMPELIGCAMTYTLFEYVKENYDDLIAGQPESAINTQNEEEKEVIQDVGKKKEKKEQLTKNQKRKMYDRINAAGERPRGYNWVDIIKHLSQTGGQT